MSDLTFDEKTHTYFVDGKRVPGFTEIMNQWVKNGTVYVNTLNGQLVPANIMEPAQDHGSTVHRASHLLLTGKKLKWAKLHTDLVNPLKQLLQWKKDYKPKFLYIEQPLYSKKYDICGTSDIICRLRIKKGLYIVIIELKTGDYDIAPTQLCVYTTMYKEWEPYRGHVLRYILHLPKQGGYNFVEDSEPFDYGWGFFMSRRYQYNYLNRRN